MRSFLCTLLLLASLAGAAQQTTPFRLLAPQTTQAVGGARYGHLDFLDSRFDTAGFGSVQVGGFDKPARVVADPPLDLQLQSLLESLGGAGTPGRLLFQLRDLRFAELASVFRQEGWCYLRANLYADAGGRYAPLARLDSVIYLHAGDVTAGLYRRCSETLAAFLQGHLADAFADTALLDRAAIAALDSTEKSGLTLYTRATYTDGIYYDYASFSRQEPNIVELMPRIKKNGKLLEVKIHMGETDEVLKSTDCYAVVSGGKAWIATEWGYHPLEREGGELYFNGFTRTSVKPGTTVLRGISGGLIGLATTEPELHHCRQRIDHVNGSFIVTTVGDRYIGF